MTMTLRTLRTFLAVLSLTASREKLRIPAWCDRILRKGDVLKQINYADAPLRFSDHKPVYATFYCDIEETNEAKKQALSREIYSRRRLNGDDPSVRGDDLDDGDLSGYEPIALELPPASSDRRKWWLDNGKGPSPLHQPDLTDS